MHNPLQTVFFDEGGSLEVLDKLLNFADQKVALFATANAAADVDVDDFLPERRLARLRPLLDAMLPRGSAHSWLEDQPSSALRRWYSSLASVFEDDEKLPVSNTTSLILERSWLSNCCGWKQGERTGEKDAAEENGLQLKLRLLVDAVLVDRAHGEFEENAAAG